MVAPATMELEDKLVEMDRVVLTTVKGSQEEVAGLLLRSPL
jgi:hypothetical protein